MAVSSLVEHHLTLDGCVNLRDLGGYVTTHGKQTRPRTILRSDSLHALPVASQRELLQYGVRTIIDLRRPGEIAREPHVFANTAGVRYVHVPLVPDDRLLRGTDPATALHAMYALLLDTCQPHFRAVFEAILDNRVPLVIHCTAGKDRTGLVAALLLALVQVPDVTIAADYALSRRLLEPLLPTFRQELVAAGYVLPRDSWMLESSPETMLLTLGYLGRRYGGATGYARRIGLSHHQISQLQQRLID